MDRGPALHWPAPLQELQTASPPAGTGFAHARAHDEAAQWLAAGIPAILVTVAAVQGSAPREPGAAMAVNWHDTAGTIGGGHLEWAAVAVARELLKASAQGSSATRPFTRHYALGPSLGQCCGGAVTLRFETLTPGGLAAWTGSASRFRLQLYGAGHVGRAIIRLLATLPCQVKWIDEREDAFPAWPLPPHIERVCAEPAQAEVDTAEPETWFLVLTHNHELDLRISEAILRRRDFGWFGLIGSKTKRARFIRRFEHRGLPQEAIARMTCPIGMAGIEGKEPEIIAVAVVAQLLAQSSVPFAMANPEP